MGVTGGGGNSGECRGGYIIGVVPAPAPRMRPWGAPKHLEQIPTGLVLTWAPSLSFPSAWWHRLRVSHLHPAGGHDISEVGGTGGAQRPHHAVRGVSRTPVPTDLSELVVAMGARVQPAEILLATGFVSPGSAFSATVTIQQWLFQLSSDLPQNANTDTCF